MTDIICFSSVTEATFFYQTNGNRIIKYPHFLFKTNKIKSNRSFISQ